MNALFTVAIIALVVLVAVIAVQRVKYKNLVQQTEQSKKDLQEKEINIHILNMGLIENSPMGDLIITCLLAFAQFERSMIVERTSSGKELAKQSDDYREGRPKKFTKKQIAHALKLLETNSYKEVGLMTGISKSTLIRAKREKMKLEIEN